MPAGLSEWSAPASSAFRVEHIGSYDHCGNGWSVAQQHVRHKKIKLSKVALDAMSDSYDLVTYSRPITTTSSEAQLWFDRGLIWGFGNNRDESAAGYRRALEYDPECAMAYWGIAYSSGRNYNKPWEAFDQADALCSVAAAYDATREAMGRLDGLSAVEKGVIGALPSLPFSDSHRRYVTLE